MVFHNQKSFGDGIFSDYNNNHCLKTLKKKTQINKQTKLSKERQNKEKPQDGNETKFHSSIYKHRQNKKNNKSSEKR